MITLRTESMRVDVDDERGATVTGVFDSDGSNALAHYDWETPSPASTGMSYGDDDRDFHSSYRGGWQETFPNAGMSATVDGVPHPFHGEAASTRWVVDEATATSCTLHVAARSPLILRRTMTLDPHRPVLRLDESVTNVGRVESDFVWGHHPAFPATAGARIDLPAGARVRPDADRAGHVAQRPSAWHDAGLDEIPDGPVHLLLYLDELSEGWAAVRQPEGGVSVALAWDVRVHPYAWLWIMRDDPAFPFYGRGRMVAVEAQTAWPYDGLANARRRGMAHRLKPEETLRSWYTLALFADDGRAVTGVTKEGSVSHG